MRALIISRSQSSDTQIEGATIFEAFAEDLGFGEFMNIRLVENEALENQGVSKNQIDQVFITKLTLEILSPRDGDDFTFRIPYVQDSRRGSGDSGYRTRREF